MSKFLKSQSKEVIILTGIGVVAVATLSAILVYRKHLAERIPKKWKKIGEVTELICYPIKSCGPIRVSNVNCSILGIENDKLRDRVFMITNLNGNFVTARTYPELVKVQPVIEDDFLVLSAPGMMNHKLDLVELSTKTTSKFSVWDQPVDCIDCGEEIARWLSRFVLTEDSGLRLVYFPSKISTRDVRERNKIFKTLHRDDSGALHDASSYMLMNESSVADLNTRLDHVVTPLQFRPNFVIKGPAAFEEDSWNWIKLGTDVVMRNIKPCTRCVFTTIDPETGTKNKEGEPLKTLKSYRLFEMTGDSPVMGIHCGVRKNGTIRVGDSVYIPCSH